MARIKKLSPDVAAKIAAGEVVEKPFNIVKELIENSVDAGASKIIVEINDGGLSKIKVTDNGGGMDAEDLPLALERFATSKAETVDDV
ncbi:MAG: ATP-binding protein, partial [Mucispirillum sp.]|nr:ATP-binding protein [Mucispirillum sp.]